MKQVVINGGGTYGSLLTPKWMVEYYRRKGIDLYVYEWVDEYDNDYIAKIINPNELDDATEIYCPYYLTENVGEVIEDFTEEIEFKMINVSDMFEDREDKVLIDIAREINNEKLIKIVEIPDDVEYDVVEFDCGFGEYIAEKHRTWC